MSVASRLKELGIELPLVSPVAIYKPAVRTGNLVFISGQLPLKGGALTATGRLGAGVSVEDGKAAARQCAINALAAAQHLLGTLEGARVVRTVGYVASAPEFVDQPQVVNGASELLKDIFGDDAGVGTRTSIGLASLPLNAPVEVELLLEVE